MKRILKQTLGFASLALISVAATAGIKDTPHNLTASNTANGVNTQSTTAQICVFCHTPHASNTDVSAPLWNKGSTAQTYQQYNTAFSSTIDGEVLAVGSVSAACLSCHDGTQAMDNLVNAPGSGGLAASTTSGSNRPYTWNLGSEKIASGSVANLGIDLRNDHPIGIEYCGGGISNGGSTTLSGSCEDKDFKTPATDVINSAPIFWVDTSNSGVRGKGDIILYTRTFTGGTKRPSVECASCHDPHQDKVSGGAPDVNFMRVTTAESKICLACHTK